MLLNNKGEGLIVIARRPYYSQRNASIGQVSLRKRCTKTPSIAHPLVPTLPAYPLTYVRAYEPSLNRKKNSRVEGVNTLERRDKMKFIIVIRFITLAEMKVVFNEIRAEPIILDRR